MKHIDRWPFCVATVLSTLAWGCNRSPPPVSGGAASGPVATVERKSIAEVATLERDEAGQVVGIAILGFRVQGLDLSELQQYEHLNELALQECPWLTNDDLKYVATLPQLETLKLIRVPITDDALVHLSEIASLRQLQLAHTKVKGAGIEHLKDLQLEHLEIHGAATVGQELSGLGDLQTLKQLVVNGPNVALADMQSVSAMSQLRILDVHVCKDVTAAAISDLNGLNALEYFRCDSNVLSDEMLEPLGRFPSLKELDLHKSQVTDAGLKHLASLANLERINFYKCQVKGQGLTHLTGLKNLNSVHFWQGQIDSAGRTAIDELSAALPNCEIVISTL